MILNQKTNSKLILITLASIVIGFSVYYFLPKQQVIIQSGIIAEKNKRELINDASVIINGKVKKSLPSFWSNPNLEKGATIRNIIQTDVVITINEVFKGKPYSDKEIKVRIDKGKIGNTTSISEGYPDFITEEEVVLFLSEDDGDLANPAENYYVLTGMTQGKFTLKEVKGSEKIFTNNIASDFAFEKDSFKLSTIKTEINNILEDLNKNPIRKMTKEEIKEQNKKLFGE